MAAAVMRAMTFGLSSSGEKEKDGRGDGREGRRSRPGSRSGSHSRSSSRTGMGAALGRTLSGNQAAADGETESLSRVNSRLSVQLGGGGTPTQGILINSRASPLPSPSTSPPSHGNGTSLYTNPSASSSLAGGLPLSHSISAPSSVSPPPHPSLEARTMSDVSSVTEPVTPVNGSFPASARPRPEGAGHQKRESTIRFAPLPEIRPRSYSTGRNVWLEDAEFDGVDEEGGDPAQRHWVRRDDADEFAVEDEEEEDDRRSGSKWGNWTEVWGLSPSTSRRSDDDAVSVASSAGGADGGGYALERTTSGSSSLNGASAASTGGLTASSSSKKLLKAFGLGALAKSSSSSASKAAKRASLALPPPSASSGNGEHDLSRTSSADSSQTQSTGAALSRRSSIDASSAASRPKGSTGIPMRKASTWEAGDSAAVGRTAAGAPVYYASPARSSRKRAMYPPVAQRSRNPVRSLSAVRAAVQVEEPKFEEWGGIAGSAVGGGARAGNGGRMQAVPQDEEDDGSGLAWLKKRRAEREKREREAAEKAAAGETEEPSQAALPTPSPALSTASAPPEQPSPSEGLRRPLQPRSPPSRSTTLDSTISTASTVRPATPQQKPSGLSTTRPVLSVDVGAADVAGGEGSSASPVSLSPTGDDDEETPITSPTSDASALSDAESEDEDEEEEEEEEREKEDDDDLDAEELAREEALAAEAKRDARGLGAERYHSASHENSIRQVSGTAATEGVKHGSAKPSPRLASGGTLSFP
ncbi:hypothetical protein JCM10213_002360 [Rhodosporidiobolus nylandii]